MFLRLECRKKLNKFFVHRKRLLKEEKGKQKRCCSTGIMRASVIYLFFNWKNRNGFNLINALWIMHWLLAWMLIVSGVSSKSSKSIAPRAVNVRLLYYSNDNNYALVTAAFAAAAAFIRNVKFKSSFFSATHSLHMAIKKYCFGLPIHNKRGDIKSVLTVEIKIKITSCIVLSKSPVFGFMFAIK